MLTEKSDAAPAPPARTTPPTARVARRPDVLLRGRLGPDARRQGQHHDPRVHVRDGDVRGHPRLLERRAGQLYGLKLREHVERIRQSCRILLMDDVPSVDELTAADRRDGPPQRLPRGRLHPAVVLQVDPGDRRPAARPRERAVHHRRCRSGTTSTPKGRPGDDLLLAAQRRRGAAGPRQDRRRLRQHGLPEVRGRAQRLRRGDRPDRRRPRQRGVRGQRVRRPRRRRS